MLMPIAQQLYQIIPDRLYMHYGCETWYAFYDYDLCVLTNSEGKLEAFCYDTKSEYRDVRRLIVQNYDLKQVKLDYVEDI